MRTFVFAALAFFIAVLPLPAQQGEQPSVILSIIGGTVTGHDLWVVQKQPLLSPGPSGQHDTLRLGRAINSSLVLGAAGTYFLNPHVGVHMEFSYMGLPFESSCEALFLNPDPNASATMDLRRNGQVCDAIGAQAAGGGAITAFTGVTLRAGSRRAFSPYVRINAGIVNLAQSSIEVSGAYLDESNRVIVRQIAQDPSPRRTSLMYGAGAGLTTPLGRGYQLRLEVRDLVTSFERLVGPVNELAQTGPTETRSYHHVSLTLGLDIVLEKKRGRRY